MIFTFRTARLHAGLLGASAVFGQTAAGPAFEVASIRPAAPVTAEDLRSGKVRLGMTINAARVEMKSAGMVALLLQAYRLKPYQLLGPDWMNGSKLMFDISAKIPEGGSSDQVPEMLQGLMAERFKLVVHRENKEQQVYALVVGKNGPKLKAAPSEAAATPTKMTTGSGGSRHIEFTRTPAGLGDFLTPYLGRPVVDMTNLKGSYLVVLDMSGDDFLNASKAARLNPDRTADVAPDPSGTSLFASVEQLGLKLESRKAPIETIVVDHLEKTPTEN